MSRPLSNFEQRFLSATTSALGHPSYVCEKSGTAFSRAAAGFGNFRTGRGMSFAPAPAHNMSETEKVMARRIMVSYAYQATIGQSASALPQFDRVFKLNCVVSAIH
jgi:hypothetical protein